MHNAKHMLSILSPRPLQGHRAVGDGDDQHVQGSTEEHKLCETPHSPITGRVRIFNLGCRFFLLQKLCQTPNSWLSVDRSSKIFGGLMTLGLVRSVLNFC